MPNIETLGERIRKLRKQKNMTLEALAGEGLTKGMLSLIENNKANPSMESLAYIAKQLGVEGSELLEEISSGELRAILEKAENLYNTDFEHMTDKYKQLIYLVKPYIPKLSHGYEAARLLEMYSISLYQETLDGWKEHSDRAAHMYEQLNMTARRASIGLFRSTVKFMERDYKKALEILQKERSDLEGKHAFIDHMTRVDYDYNEAAIYFALGDSDSAKRVMESAIEYSRENRIFYRIDDLYRLAAAEAMMTRKTEKRLYY
ncbi:MAG TPA: helix-turn-helix transcriptional regulator, partial [Bacillaceae bacterium]